MFHGITFAPYKLEAGGAARWDEIAQSMGDRSLAAYQRFVKNLTSDNIIRRTVVTPLDHSRNLPNSMVGGDVHGVAPYFYQTGGHRPTPDLAQYVVPGVDRLYLVGPFQHPGGGVYGAGRGTAMRMFEDLGMDFARSIAGVAGAKRAVNLAPSPATTSAPTPTGTNATTASGIPAIAAENTVTLYGPSDEALLVIRSVERDGDALVVKGQAYGTMPLSARLEPAQARRALRLFKGTLLPFLFSFLFRRSTKNT
jgi:hypothetical protein